MIVDVIKNRNTYLKMGDKFDKAFEFIENYMIKELPIGRYTIMGEDVYAMVQSYETSEDSQKSWETHNRYIDLQFVAQGSEKIYWTNIEGLTIEKPYDDKSDCALFTGRQGTGIKLSDNHFMILFPKDAHKPGCIWDKSQRVKKIVVKIKVD